MASKKRKAYIFGGTVIAIATILVVVSLIKTKTDEPEDHKQGQTDTQRKSHIIIKCVEEIEVATPNLEEYGCSGNETPVADCVKLRLNSDLCLTCSVAMNSSNRTYKNDKCCEFLSLCKATQSDYCHNGGYLHCHSQKERTRRKTLICKCPKGWTGKDCSQEVEKKPEDKQPMYKLIMCQCYKLVINQSPYCKLTTFNATEDKECIAERRSGVEKYCVCDNRHSPKLKELENIERCKK